MGARPAGLGEAVALINNGVIDLIIVDRNSIVGGLSITKSFGGSRFDVGPQRFFLQKTMRLINYSLFD